MRPCFKIDKILVVFNKAIATSRIHVYGKLLEFSLENAILKPLWCHMILKRILHSCINRWRKGDKMLNLAFYLFPLTRLINSIILEYSFKIHVTLC